MALPTFNIKKGGSASRSHVNIEPEEAKKPIPSYKFTHGSLPPIFSINLRLAPQDEIKIMLSAQ